MQWGTPGHGSGSRSRKTPGSTRSPLPSSRFAAPLVDAREDLLRDPKQRGEVLEVGADRGVDPRVLHLDRDLAPVVQPRAVDLADRGRRDRLLREAVEQLGDRFFEIVLDHAPHLRKRHRRRRVA